VISSASSIRGARYCFSLEIYLAPILAVPPEAILETDLVKVPGVVVVLNNVPPLLKSLSLPKLSCAIAAGPALTIIAAISAATAKTLSSRLKILLLSDFLSLVGGSLTDPLSRPILGSKGIFRL
jgi:hypothetical protein